MCDPSPPLPLQALTQARLSFPGPEPVHKEQVSDVRGMEEALGRGGVAQRGKARVGRDFCRPAGAEVWERPVASLPHIPGSRGPVLEGEGSWSQARCW